MKYPMMNCLSHGLLFFGVLVTLQCNAGITAFLSDKGPDAWTRRRKLTIDNTAQAENLTNFPLLVRVDSARIDYAQVQDAGQDIQFRDSDGSTVLSHEIEKWNEAGSSYIWVRVPQIDAASASDYIWMYYGNAATSDGQAVTAVWDANFRGVWHLGSSTNDSTINAFHGTNVGTTTTTGLQGEGRLFGGAEWINLGTNKAFLNNAASVTMSGCLKAPANITTLQGVLSFAVSGAPSNASRASLRLTNSNQLDFAGRSTDTDTTSGRTTSASPLNPAASWYCVTAVANYAGKSVVLYVNGSAKTDNGTNLTPLWAANATDNANSACGSIGAEDDGSGAFFSGILDEVRFANTARSAAWIAADYKSLSDGFLTFGSEETDPRQP